MSFFISGAIIISGASAALTASKSRKAQKKAAKKARADVVADDKRAREAEVFAETEGEGIGNLGKISLEVDDDLEDDEISTGNIRI